MRSDGKKDDVTTERIEAVCEHVRVHCTAESVALIDSTSELGRWKCCAVYAFQLNCCGSATWDSAVNDDRKTFFLLSFSGGLHERKRDLRLFHLLQKWDTMTLVRGELLSLCIQLHYTKSRTQCREERKMLTRLFSGFN